MLVTPAPGDMTCTGIHLYHGHGYHLTEKQGLFLDGRTSGVSLVAVGCGEGVLSAAMTEELEFFQGSCAEEMESEVQTIHLLGFSPEWTLMWISNL